MTLITIKKYPGDPMNLDQIEGVPLTMTLLSPDNVQLHSPVMCKDYLNDSFWSEITKQNVNVYGFYWQPGNFDPYRRVQRLHLKFKTTALADESMYNILELLNAWERQLGFPRTRHASTTRKNSRVLFVSRKWTEAPIRISLYTLMIRIGKVYIPGTPIPDFLHEVKSWLNSKWGDPKPTRPMLYPADTSMVWSAADRMIDIYNKKAMPIQTFTEFTGGYAIHNDSGIVNYKQGHALS